MMLPLYYSLLQAFQRFTFQGSFTRSTRSVKNRRFNAVSNFNFGCVQLGNIKVSQVGSLSNPVFQGLCHKTHYGRNFWISVISQSVCTWQAFPQPTRLKHLSGAPLQGRLLALPTNTRLCWIGLPGINTSLLRKSVNYGRIKFHHIKPWTE